MKRKVVAAVLTMAMAGSLLAGCGSSSSDDSSSKSETTTTDESASSDDSDSADSARGDFSGVSITMLNTKSEIESQLEAAAEQWGELTGAKLEVYTIGSGTPSQEVSARYAAKNAPTLIMCDPQDVASICEEKGVDLSDESWAANGGTQYGITGNDGKLYSFPFCIEGRGMIYNKTAIEDTLGEDWDPASVTNMDDFEALLKKLVDNGMESPVALNQEDWSNAGHYFTQVYEEQDGTLTGTEKIMEDLRNGSVDLMSNERFTSLMDTYDLLMEYNINKADPLAADYDENAADLAEGDVAFWFNGNWAWAEISDYIEDDTEIGIMPVPQNGTEGNANVNDYICGGATKQVMIDKECNDEKQQAAAKDFLDWLANTAEGNKVLVDDCSLVPAFSNITEEATNMLGQSIQRYTVEGKLFDQPSNYPGDHWSEVGAIMQKYLEKQIGTALPALKGCYFFCKGTGKRMRDLARWPMENGSIIRILDDCASYVIIADNAVMPTSELPSHLSVHARLIEKGSNYKATVHTHPIELIAMSHNKKFMGKDVLSNLLWSMIPETKAFCPLGLGIVPYQLPGSLKLAEETLKELEDYDVVMWEKHGVFAKGLDVMDAFDQIDVLSKSAKIYIDSKCMGFEPDGMSQEEMAEMTKAFNLPR